MSLVAYEYSDSENENSETEENNEVDDENVGKVEIPKVPEITETENTELFSRLPTPKNNSQPIIEEDDDEFLRKTVPKPEITKPKNIVKIMIPSLSDFNNDEDTDEVPKKIFRPTITPKSATTGLFSVLPPPKTVIAPTTKFVPNSVSKKPIQPPKAVVKPVEKVDKTNNIDDDLDDEGKQESGSFFFTSIFDNIPETKLPLEELPKPQTTVPKSVDSARNIQESDLRTNRYFAEMVNANIAQNQTVQEVEESEEDKLMKEAYTNLVGKSRKAKGKGNKNQEIEIVDINAADIMPDPREWMTKSLTEEQPVQSSCKKGDEPSLQQRRKHQITYLAYQAKLNEQELKNQWALNKMSRKQTQAKYGF